MPDVFINIGSNIDPRRHIPESLEELRQQFGEITVSKCYESQAIGFEGDNFLNLSVSFISDLSVAKVNAILHQIEDLAGRERNAGGDSWCSRTLDIDLLLYGSACDEIDGVELPRPDILEFSHVLVPLTELAANRLHPKLGISFAKLSSEMQFPDQSIWEVPLAVEIKS